jgi:hypothetical protein
MRSVVNFCLANLAVADLSVGIFCVLPNLSLYMSQQWLIGRVSSLVTIDIFGKPQNLIFFGVVGRDDTASWTLLDVVEKQTIDDWKDVD